MCQLTVTEQLADRPPDVEIVTVVAPAASPVMVTPEVSESVSCTIVPSADVHVTSCS